MTSAGPEDLVVTRAALAEWSVISGWAADEGWNPGLSDAPAFFAQDPEGFFIGRVGEEPVSAISVVNYDADYAFLGFYLVRPDLRGRGLGPATWRTALAHAGGRTIGLDGVVAQQHNYRRSGFEPAHRTLRFAGAVPADRPAPGVRPAGKDDLDAVTEYDASCHPADRPRFLKHWLSTSGHRAFVRLRDGRLTGCAVIRPAHDRPRIGPLFADTAEDAEALLLATAAAAAGGEVALDVPLSNPAAVTLAERFGLSPSFETARMYTGPVRPFAADRVFGVTTLELG